MTPRKPMSDTAPHFSEILNFWFNEPVKNHWFQSTDEIDQTIRDRFEGVWREAAAGRLDHWAEGPEGALALVIVLDQFPLNMFRGRAEAFASEDKARAVAEWALDRGWDRELPLEQRHFIYLPYMHSEALADQERSVALYEESGLEDGLKWARHHRDIVRRFGRFPHRNAALGRESTPEEAAWLASDEAYHG